MKIAVCFFGLAFGYGRCHAKTPKNVRKRTAHALHTDALRTIEAHVYQNHDCDVFFHAWVDKKERTEWLIKKLSPKEYVTEAPRQFHEDSKFSDLNLHDTLEVGPKDKLQIMELILRRVGFGLFIRVQIFIIWQISLGWVFTDCQPAEELISPMPRE